MSLGIGEAIAQATTIKIASFVPPRSVSVSKVLTPWMKSVEAAAGGEIELRGYWGGYAVPLSSVLPLSGTIVAQRGHR